MKTSLKLCLATAIIVVSGYLTVKAEPTKCNVCASGTGACVENLQYGGLRCDSGASGLACNATYTGMQPFCPA